MWRAYLADTMTGLIDSPLDLPSFSWSMSIGDFALTTTRGKDVGEGEASGIRVPWDAVPGSTPSARAREVCADRRSVVLFWRSSWTPEGELVLLQCLLGGFGSVFPQCGLMVFPGAVIVSR